MNSLLSVILVAALPVPAGPPALAWAPCGAAECATLTVPVDWSRPYGEKIGIEVARRKATGDRVGTLVFGPGGPWDSGVDWVANRSYRFSAAELSHFDVVSFDPRGINGTKVECDMEPQIPIIHSAAEFDATVRHNQDLWKTCAARTGAVWNHADMLSNVRDVEELRKALGERQISFHGTSYGTLLGEQYAERYPDRVRAMVLESVDDHSVPTTAAFLTTQAAAFEDAFDDFADWCAASTACSLHGRDVRAIWNDLRTANRADFGEFDLLAITLKRLKDAAYPTLADYLRSVSTGGTGVRAPGLGVVTPAFCADWSLPVRDYAEYASLVHRSEAVAPDTHYPPQLYALSMCLGWQHVANPQHRLRVHTATPLLLLNSRHDPATGWNWARAVERQLGPEGVLVTYEGAGHGAYNISTDCLQPIADDYLVSLTVPARGTTCPAR